jgi:hypothetical protein
MQMDTAAPQNKPEKPLNMAYKQTSKLTASPISLNQPHRCSLPQAAAHQLLGRQVADGLRFRTTHTPLRRYCVHV